MQQTILKEHVLTRINANDLRLVRFDRPDTSCRKMFLKGKKYTVIKNGVESAPSSLNKLPKETNIGGNYFLYLPVPTEVATALDQKCLKDQNIALVKSPVAANLSFYCTYSENLKSVIYVVTDQETTGKKRMNNTHTVPYYYFPAIDPKTQKPLSPQQISDNIYNMLLMYASKYGWINKSPKKKT
jgi:hypothetical protein